MECPYRPKLGQSGIFRIFDHERYPDQSEYLYLSPIKRSVARCHEVMNVWRYEEWAVNLRMSLATGTVPERVQSRVHTTEPTGPVPEPFHCDHIARWSARSGTTGRSGTDVNTGARLRSGTVPVPKLWCEHGLSHASLATVSLTRNTQTVIGHTNLCNKYGGPWTLAILALPDNLTFDLTHLIRMHIEGKI